MSFRRRMVLLAAGAVATAVVLASVVVYVVTRNDLLGQTDASLREKLIPGQAQSVQIRTKRLSASALAKLEREGKLPPASVAQAGTIRSSVEATGSASGTVEAAGSASRQARPKGGRANSRDSCSRPEARWGDRLCPACSNPTGGCCAPNRRPVPSSP